jgi:hypothetical protein
VGHKTTETASHGSVGVGPTLELVLSGGGDVVEAKTADGREEDQWTIERLDEVASEKGQRPELGHSTPPSWVSPEKERPSARHRVRAETGAKHGLASLEDDEPPRDGRLWETGASAYLGDRNRARILPG